MGGAVSEYVHEVVALALTHQDPVAVLSHLATQCAATTWAANTPLQHTPPGAVIISPADCAPTEIPAWDEFVTLVFPFESCVPHPVALGVLTRVAQWQEPQQIVHLAQLVAGRFWGLDANDSPELAIVERINEAAQQKLRAAHPTE